MTTPEKKISVDSMDSKHVLGLVGELQYGGKEEIEMTTEEKKEEYKKCPRCNSDVPPEHRACVKCGEYNPIGGETIDISKTSFSLPELIASRVMRPPSTTSEHDLPFPAGLNATEIQTDPDAQRWIFNHLPLKEEEKQKILEDFTKEYHRGKVTKLKEDSKKRVDLTRTQLKREESGIKTSGKRKAVKNRS